MDRIRAVTIEDDPLAAQYLAALREDGCQVEVVGSPVESEAGLRLCAELRPEAVFLDISPPDTDGISPATPLAMLPQPPRLVLTRDNPSRAGNAFRLEAVDCLFKPFDPEQVAESVNRVVSCLRPLESPSCFTRGFAADPHPSRNPLADKLRPNRWDNNSGNWSNKRDSLSEQGYRFNSSQRILK